MCEFLDLSIILSRTQLIKTRKFLLLIIPFLIANITSAQTINYNYDSLSRLTQVIYPDSSIIKYTYDAAGNRINKAFIRSTIFKICPQSNISFFAGLKDNTKNYQWQVDTSNGFKNVTLSAIYSGVDSSTLTLNKPPTNWYNYKYRCTISDIKGSTTSPVFTLKFAVTWVGVSDTTWGNIANWSCGSLPDSNTDVIINPVVPNFPDINSNVSCRSLTVNAGAVVKVKTGYKLNVVGKKE